MSIRRCTKIAFWGTFILLLSAGSVMADSLEVAVNQGAIVYSGDSSDVRLVMEIALPQALDSTQIRFAELQVPITSIIPDSTALTLYCRPLLASWEPNTIDWEDLGDFPDTSVVSFKGTHFGTAQSGSQTAYFDITRLIKRWQGNTMTNNGLVLYANPRQQSRFTCPRQGNEPYATVRIIYEPPVN